MSKEDVEARSEAMRQRLINHMAEDFLPIHDPSRFPNEMQRIANAAEYSAHHLGQISKHLARISAQLDAKK